MEERHVSGGLSSTVLEHASSGLDFALGAIGMQDTYGESGPCPELPAKYGIRREEIFRRSRLLVETVHKHKHS